MKKKILTLLVLLMTAVTGAVAQTPELLVTIESRQNSDFIFGSMTFGGKAIVTFSNDVGNVGDNWGWYTYPGSGGSLLTVTSVEGYTITSCKFYTEGSGDAVNGYTIEGESPSVYLINIGVFTDASQSVKIGDPGITKIEVYGYAPAPAGPADYYLVGNMTSWGINPQYKLALNESAGDANEYQIALALPAATELKVVSSTDGTTIKDWFPAEAGNKYVQNDGLYTIYFRPGYNGGDDWHANCIYVADGVNLTADGEAWTLAQMPACDVELEVEYYPLATLATQPAAAEGVVEGTDAALLTPGTSAEGTLAYALGTSEAPTGQWSDAIPTAQDLTAGTCYVWYKVVGDADHSDSQPQSIEVTIAEAPAYAVTIDDAGVDASNWQATPAVPKTGQTVTLSYSGKKKIRSITIEKAAAPAATVTTAPTAKTGVKAGQNEAIVNAGEAEGGTMMYAVTTDNTQPASTDGFSATVPTAEGLTAGTYYVWYYVEADDSHTDSEISATGIAVTIASAYTMAAAATSADKGKLICTDGHIHAYGADAACTKARVAKIIYIGTTGHATYSHGLALALNDEASTMAWQDAIDACSAKNTSTPVTGATWLQASYYQWGYMLGASGAGSYTALRDGFSSVGGDNLQSEVGYWSSTQSSDRQAYYFNFNKSDYFTGLKTYAKWVRACLAF